MNDQLGMNMEGSDGGQVSYNPSIFLNELEKETVIMTGIPTEFLTPSIIATPNRPGFLSYGFGDLKHYKQFLQ
jgi:hypothetical protein